MTDADDAGTPPGTDESIVPYDGQGNATGLVENDMDVEDLMVAAGQEALDAALGAIEGDPPVPMTLDVEVTVEFVEVIDV